MEWKGAFLIFRDQKNKGSDQYSDRLVTSRGNKRVLGMQETSHSQKSVRHRRATQTISASQKHGRKKIRPRSLNERVYRKLTRAAGKENSPKTEKVARPLHQYLIQSVNQKESRKKRR